MLAYETDGNYYTIKKERDIDQGVKDNPVFDQEKHLVKVILRNNPKENYFVNTLNYVKHAHVNYDGFDRGHFIADSLKPFLLTQEEIRVNKKQVELFFGKGNVDNISPQSPEANRNSVKFAGQLRFEQKILNYLKNTEANREVYYEIEEIIIDKDVVLGRRIYIEFLNSNMKNIHVFIPDAR